MNTTLLLKTNKALKDEASRVAKELGVPLTTVINAYLRQFVRDRKVTISMEPTPRKEKIALWESISDEMDKDIKNQKVFTNVDDLFKHLKI
jgi:addiction module RelB/DinJ family antitoxin